ncbi:UDP-N-acetylglucosamine--N-acetylmuramyl-(pentapeptide) pyrophosphoryl-undecaprenol N-acetylglucosamine transferase [Alphaproteobacteria bacterium]|nr:UDP-N-acetylglucosamine--N-acetylmuramyl-(pentapeptide) pyrophosphoryl-undecaprenol N-acetylglucosamine transferase [Alphaproteobacteria bacterium]
MAARLSAPIFLAAGGTGGHVFPAIAVADALLLRGHSIQIVTDKRGRKLIPNRLPCLTISAASPFSGSQLSRALALVKLGFGALEVGLKMLISRPSLVIGFGGYPSASPLLMAQLLRIPAILHEQNAIMGRTNQVLAQRCKSLLISWADTAGLPESPPAHHLGLPVREAFASIERYHAKAGAQVNLLILGGSLGAQVFASLLPDAITALPEQVRARLSVTQQARTDQHDAVASRYRALGIDAEIARFFDDVPARMARADIIISRSGASSVAEIAAAGRASILIPFPSALDDHQRANADVLLRCGGADIASEAGLSPQKLADILLPLITDEAHRIATADAARTASLGNAAAAIALHAEQITGKTAPLEAA